MAEKNIGGRTFRTAPLLATDAIILQARLMKVAGPALGSLGAVFPGMKKDASEEQKAQANGAALAALADIFVQANPVELAGLLKALCETAQILRPSGSYDRLDFDGDMSDSKGDILPLALWVVREQFGDFFSGLLRSGGLAKMLRA